MKLHWENFYNMYRLLSLSNIFTNEKEPQQNGTSQVFEFRFTEGECCGSLALTNDDLRSKAESMELQLSR